jgi:hypothetical protein
VKKKKWISDLILTKGLAYAKSQSAHEEFKEFFDSDTRFSTYLRQVYRYRPPNKPLDPSEVFAMLEKRMQDSKEKITPTDLKELAEDLGSNPSEFYKINGFAEFLTELNKASKDFVEDGLKELHLTRKVKSLETELKSYKDNQLDVSSIVKAFEDAVEVYEPPKKPKVDFVTSEKERVVVGLLSDIHCGEVVSFEETMGVNAYNVTILKTRLDSFFTQLVEYAQEVKSDVLYLKLLGDIVNGEIHEELLKYSDISTVKSLLEVSDYIAWWLSKIREHFKEIKVLGLSGNHGRFSKKPSFKGKNKENFDYIAYEFIRRETRDIVKEFILPESAFYIDEILGNKFFSTHGDIFKGGTGLQPMSGTWGRDIAKLGATLGGFDYAEFGHFHRAMAELPTFGKASILVNGSVKGADEFSLQAVKSGERPAQLVYTVEEEYGAKFITRLYLD